MSDNTVSEKHVEICDDNMGIYYCGKRINSENHVYGPEIRTHFLIVLVEKGSAVLYKKDKPVIFGEKNILVMFPNEKIFYHAKSNWSIKWIGISGEKIENNFRKIGITRENPIFSPQNFYAISELFTAIYDVNQSNHFYAKFKTQSLLYEFFAEIFNEKSVKDTDAIASAVRIMEYNYNNTLKIKEIADKFFLDEAYFSRLFKRKTGISPKKYILKLRIRYALELLENTEYKITVISNTVGFEDSLYFSKVFHKMVGMTPTEYRKRHRKK